MTAIPPVSKNTVDANGNYPSDDGVSARGRHLFVTESPAGATIKLQMTLDAGTTWVDVENGSFTSAVTRKLDISESEAIMLRANVASYVSGFSFWL